MAQKVERPQIPEPVAAKIAEIQEEEDFSSAGEVYRWVLMEAGYDL